jgi:uncharacterized membrane protein
MEHRWGERVLVDFPVRLTAHPFTKRSGRLTDLSVSGAYIEVSMDVRVLARIEVSILAVTWAKHEASVIAAYVTRKYRQGVGIEWCEFAPPVINGLLSTVVRRPYAFTRHPTSGASVTIARLSGNLLKHGD